MTYEWVRLILTPISIFLVFVCNFSEIQVTEKTEVEVLFMQIITEKDKNDLVREMRFERTNSYETRLWT